MKSNDTSPPSSRAKSARNKTAPFRTATRCNVSFGKSRRISRASWRTRCLTRARAMRTRTSSPDLLPGFGFCEVLLRDLATASAPVFVWLLHPVGDEDVCLVGSLAVAVGGPDEALPVGGEHGESIEIGVVGDALLSGAVFVDDVEIEVAAIFGIGLIRSKNDALAVGQPIRTKVGRAVSSDLVLVGAVGVHNPDFQVARTDEAGGVKVLVVLDFFGGLGMLGAVDDFRAVVRPEGPP